jgi:cell division topological specificity factor
MSIFGFLRKTSSANKAKERLTVILSYERKGLAPNFAEIIQKDLFAVFLKYPQFDSSSMDVEFKTRNDRGELYISIPFHKA